jgi:hypothetical protein
MTRSNSGAAREGNRETVTNALTVQAGHGLRSRPGTSFTLLSTWLPLPLGEGWGEGLGGCVPFRKLVLEDEGFEDDTK